MKSSELKTLLKETLKEVIQEELREILLEAIKSKPNINEQHNQSPIQSKFESNLHSNVIHDYKNMMESEFSFNTSDLNSFSNPTPMNSNSPLPNGSVGLDQIMGLINK